MSDRDIKALSPSGRFGRLNRLSQSADFERTFHYGRRRRTKYFSVHYCGNTVGFARLGIAVGRRVAGKANRRNRIKRALKEAFRRNLFGLPSIDIIILARPACCMLMKTRLNQEVSTLIETLLLDEKD